MKWILIAYLFALVYIAVNRSRFPKRGSLRSAWVWFALVPITQFVFTLFRAGTGGSGKALFLVETWADGIGWLFLGISLLCLTDLFGEPNDRSAEPDAAPKGGPAASVDNSKAAERPPSVS